MLSELVSSRTKSQTTSTTTSHQDAADKLAFLTSPTLIQRLQATPSSPFMSTAQPSDRLLGGPTNKAHISVYTSEGDTTEPVSLEMFNKAATRSGNKRSDQPQKIH